MTKKTMIIMKIIASNECDGMPCINYLFQVIRLLLQPYQIETMETYIIGTINGYLGNSCFF